MVFYRYPKNIYKFCLVVILDWVDYPHLIRLLNNEERLLVCTVFGRGGNNEQLKKWVKFNDTFEKDLFESKVVAAVLEDKKA